VDGFEETVGKVVVLAEEHVLIELPDGSRRQVALPPQIDIHCGQEVGLIEFDDGSAPVYNWVKGRKTRVTKLYVRLLDEGVEVWRPVRGIHWADDVYRILSEPREGERWEFASGTAVRCRPQTFPDGEEQLVAFEAV
jgi:hypothetical protein